MMLLQDNLTSLDDYLEMLHDKVSTDESFYRADYSLVDLSLNSYSKDGQTQYGTFMRSFGSRSFGFEITSIIQRGDGLKDPKHWQKPMAHGLHSTKLVFKK